MEGQARSGCTGLGQKCTRPEPVAGRDDHPHPAGRGVRVGTLIWPVERRVVASMRRVRRLSWVGKIKCLDSDCAGVDASSATGVHGGFDAEVQEAKIAAF